MQGLNKLHELIIMILQSYITKFYVSQEKSMRLINWKL